MLIWKQRSGFHDGVEEPVCWDYHVVLVGVDASGSWAVWDLDTTLPFPCPLHTYLAAAFLSRVRGKPVPERYLPYVALYCIVLRCVVLRCGAARRGGGGWWSGAAWCTESNSDHLC